MSMQLELQLSADWNAKAAKCDLATADESALRYDALLGDLIFRASGVNFSTQWGWIPLLDLAYCLKDMSDEILTGEPEAAFEFTESEAWLRFANQGNTAEISASYVPQRVTVDLKDLCGLLAGAAQSFFTQVASQNPDLASNPSFQRMRERVFAPPRPKEMDGAHPN